MSPFSVNLLSSRRVESREREKETETDREETKDTYAHSGGGNVFSKLLPLFSCCISANLELQEGSGTKQRKVTSL